MRSLTLGLLSLLTTAHSAHLPPARTPRRVDQSINPRAEYIGGWAWATSDTCSGAWSVTCGTSNNSCCPTGETCFKTGYGAYCCPTGADCINKLLTLPACADQSMEMYPWPWAPRFFCCLPGLVAIVPYTGDGGLCLPADQNVPASEILTATKQVGVGLSRTSIPVVSATNPPTSGTITNYTPSIPTSSSTSCTITPCPTANPTGAGTQPSSNSPHGLNTSAIGGIAAAGAVLAIIAFCFIKQTRKRRRMNDPSRTEVFPTITPHPAKPMYVSTGQPYFTPQPARGTESSSAPAPHESANTQSPVPASVVPVSPLSARVASPPPPYGSSPAAQYGELHGEAVGPGELDGGNAVGGRAQGGWRTDGRENVTGRQEM
ncbi:hypothetical protein V502_03220 [Pseudogymnoascus sp. VKM F-4520 (FW-2644)]|nr:hypothetical protein V502_03220 [Pseudogymnoascus sp. VKM F-4520 (FW-2644)]